MPWTKSDLDWVAARLLPEIYDINQRWLYERNTRRLEALYDELTMPRRLIESAIVNGEMRPVGYVFDNDGTPGPHRRTGPGGFQYQPQFVEIPAMNVVDRIRNKAAQASGVVSRVVTKVEAGLDEIIGSEQPLLKHADESFAPHLSAIAETKNTLDGVKSALDVMTNGGPSLDPLPGSGGELKD